MTLHQLASAIYNNVMSGLRATTNVVFSVEQLEDEIVNGFSNLLVQLSSKMRFNPDEFAQFSGIKTVDIANLPDGEPGSMYNKIAHIEIPRISSTFGNKSITYLGPADMSLDMKRYFDNSYMQHEYNMMTSSRPYAYVSTAINNKGVTDIYLFNIGILDKIAVYAVFEDPLAIYGGSIIAAEDVEFPAPKYIQDMIISSITNKYIEYYRKLNAGYEPNTQTQIT